MLKKPMSIPEQIEKMSSHGIIVDDIDFATRLLSTVSYYRLSGYTIQYRTETSSHSLSYNISLDKIYKLYCFDSELRSLLRKYLEITEFFYKDLISDIFAAKYCINEPYDQHYNILNYHDQAGIQKTFSIFEKEKSYYKDGDIVKHHRKKYNDRMPLWVIMDLMTFSSVSMFYHAMYRGDQSVISAKCGISASTLENHLHCLSVFRNKCSHGARLYNTTINPPARFTKSFLQNNPLVKNNSIFAYILVLFKRLPDDNIRIDFRCRLYRLLTKYKDIVDLNLLGFPNNYRKIMSLKNN